MDPTISAWMQLVFRWVHVVAGIAWIGHLYFFNFVNAQVVKTYDADSKKKVVPELMPRALYWFRWGAMYTWVTGLLLLGLVYYHGKLTVPADSTLGTGLGAAIGVGGAFVAFAIYDVLWKAMAKQEQAGAAVSFVLVMAVSFGLAQIFTGRSVFIHVGGWLGTIMAANVWMRIWPAQRKIIAATKAGTAPDAALAATAGLRSKHNTYMSVPLVFTMISNHYPEVYGSEWNWLLLSALVGIGWLITKFLYNKSASAAPTQYGQQSAAGATKPA
jgi:uncharacterized membrane protein